MIVDRSKLFTPPQLITFEHQIFMYRFFWRTLSHPPINFQKTNPLHILSHTAQAPPSTSTNTRLETVRTKRKGKSVHPSSSAPSTTTTGNSEDHPNCSSCHLALISGDVVALESCHYIFCVPCLQLHIRRSKEPQIPCPLKSLTNCTGYLLDPEIKQYISNQEFEAYLLRSLTTALEGSQDLTLCLAEGCHGICAIASEDDITSFYCPLCNKLNCLRCKTTHAQPCQSVLKRKCSSNSESQSGESSTTDLFHKIAMKGPKLDTASDIHRKKEWEESWNELCANYSSDQNLDKNYPSSQNQSHKVNKSDNWIENGNGFQEKEGSVSEGFPTVGLRKVGKEFECSICYLDILSGEGVMLQECFHRFCRECLSSTIEHSEDPVVKCPFQSGNYSCPSQIMDKEIKALLTPQLYDAHLKKSLNKAELTMKNSFHCKLVNCHGWVEVDERRVQTVFCPICSKPNCVPCKAIHQELTCTEYQNRLKEGECDSASQRQINTILKKGAAMRCPTCKVVIEKNGGCDGITCAICKTMLCWPTKGPRWGPKGVGDTSGGCGCRPDKKCHPKCGFCH